jgi:hypothetical protein
MLTDTSYAQKHIAQGFYQAAGNELSRWRCRAPRRHRNTTEASFDHEQLRHQVAGNAAVRNACQESLE